MSNKTILLIDDELNVRELVELCLTDLGGWNVVIPNSLVEGFQQALFNHPDAIVMDLSMHCMDYFKFMNQLRNNPETQAIPVVLLSAAARWLEPDFLQQYAISGVILKPFNPLTLSDRISQILGWHSLPISQL
ncbi:MULTISPECIES: response regulator [Calothrix]|uniref:Response regulator n=2 Tax=Calothrix TaxID=1186 RepID=A0ABR8A2V8_9CYAN|nr:MULTISPECIES: response regulator [Calothrix]MBD2194210.1 response regulator [Calothrix parietina FACHB-288]MBD2225006.1 response regulator [Calothrix anomala FACHB-343]